MEQEYGIHLTVEGSCFLNHFKNKEYGLKR